MRRRLLVTGLAALAWLAIRGAAQRTGSTSLVMRVPPEARVDPPQVALDFRVSDDGTSDVTTISAVLVARVRTLPGQAIGVTALLPGLQGPGGAVSVSSVRWTGSATAATGPARQAVCSSGTFRSGAAQDLATGWQTSGTLTCALQFELVQPRSLPPGAYTGMVQFAVAGSRP